MKSRSVSNLWETFNARKLDVPTPSQYMLMSDFFDDATEACLLEFRDMVIAGQKTQRLNVRPLGVSLLFIFTKGLICLEVPRGEWYNFMIYKRSEIWPSLYISLMEKT